MERLTWRVEMALQQNVDTMLNDCFFAIGQGFGDELAVEYEAIVHLRDRYHEKFRYAVDVCGNSWDEDRRRVLAVSRWLGQRARHHADGSASLGSDAAARAAAEIEAGCRMSKLRSERDAVEPHVQ